MYVLAWAMRVLPQYVPAAAGATQQVLHQHIWSSLVLPPPHLFLLLMLYESCAAAALLWCTHCSQDMLWWALYKAEAVLHKSALRRWALREVMKHVHYEVRVHLVWGRASVWGWA